MSSVTDTTAAGVRAWQPMARELLMSLNPRAAIGRPESQ